MYTCVPSPQIFMATATLERETMAVQQNRAGGIELRHTHIAFLEQVSRGPRQLSLSIAVQPAHRGP